MTNLAYLFIYLLIDLITKEFSRNAHLIFKKLSLKNITENYDPLRLPRLANGHCLEFPPHHLTHHTNMMSHGHSRRALYVVGPERAARLTGHEHLHLKRLLWSWHSSVEIEFRVSVDLSVELLNSAQQDGSAAADSPSPTGARYLIVFVEEGAIAALDSEAHARVTPAALSTARTPTHSPRC